MVKELRKINPFLLSIRGTHMKNKRNTLILEPISKRINVVEGSTVYESLLALNLPIGALCAGKGTCGKCVISVLDPNPKISEPSEQEKKILNNQKILEGYRLACQTKILGDLRVFLTDSLISRGIRILVDADLESLGRSGTNNLKPFWRSLGIISLNVTPGSIIATLFFLSMSSILFILDRFKITQLSF